MSRASDAGNGVMKAVEDVCNLYDVPVTRMQSRTFTVPGKGGKERPFFVGEWIDRMGVKRRKGMADLLAQPSVCLGVLTGKKELSTTTVTIPLWIECKAGTGKLTGDQQAFKEWVDEIGAAYLCVTDSCEELLNFFKHYDLRRR